MNSIVESCDIGCDESPELWLKEDMIDTSSSDGIGGTRGVRVASETQTGNILDNLDSLKQKIYFL